MSTFPKAPRFHNSRIPTLKDFTSVTPLTTGPARFIDRLHARSPISTSQDRNESPSLGQHIHKSDAGHTPHPHHSPYGIADLLVFDLSFNYINVQSKITKLQEVIKLLRRRLELKDELFETLQVEIDMLTATIGEV